MSMHTLLDETESVVWKEKGLILRKNQKRLWLLAISVRNNSDKTNVSKKKLWKTFHNYAIVD